MTRILALLRRDLLSTTRDQLLIYATLASFLVALVLRYFLLPSVGQTAINVVVTKDAPASLVEQLERYAYVDVVDDRAALERRVLASDDAVGILVTGAGYTLVQEGNESRDAALLPAVVLRKIAEGGAPAVAVEDVGGPQFPMLEMVGAFLAVSAIFIASMVMGFHIVEDKETGMMQALGVSPLGRREYVLARSLLVFGLSVVIIFGTLWLLGLTAFDHLKLLAVVVVGGVVSALVGFVLGALSSNQITAIANIKFGLLIMLMPAFLTLVIPENLWVVLYWTPSYWAFMAFRAVLVENAAWGTLGTLLLWNLGLSLAYAAVAYPWLKGKLDFARN